MIWPSKASRTRRAGKKGAPTEKVARIRQRRTVARPLVPDPCCSPLSAGVVFILLPGCLTACLNVPYFAHISPENCGDGSSSDPFGRAIYHMRPTCHSDCNSRVMVAQTAPARVKSRGRAHPLATGRDPPYSFPHGNVARTGCRPLSGCALPFGSQALNG